MKSNNCNLQNFKTSRIFVSQPTTIQSPGTEVVEFRLSTHLEVKMDIAALRALIIPCLPLLMKVTDGVGSAIGGDAWNKAKQIWEQLSPKLSAKEDARIAAEQVAAKPESKARQGVFQEELEARQHKPNLTTCYLEMRMANSQQPRLEFWIEC